MLSSLEDGRYIEANEAFLETMGYQQEEVIGKTSFELGTWVDTEDRRRLVAQVREAGGIRSVEVQRKTRSGTIIDTLFS
ncbi:MAG: PAS domain-containing protein, partial [Desulfatiglandaceae bacterium]